MTHLRLDGSLASVSLSHLCHGAQSAMGLLPAQRDRRTKNKKLSHWRRPRRCSHLERSTLGWPLFVVASAYGRFHVFGISKNDGLVSATMCFEFPLAAPI